MLSEILQPTSLAYANDKWFAETGNAVFEVMPDSILYLAPVKFSLSVIIGFPVIAQLKEIHIFSNGKMIIPARQSQNILHNLALDGLDPVISLKTGNDTLSFHFDLGATSTELYAAYFNKYKSQIIKEGRIKTVEVGGAGGVQKKTSTWFLRLIYTWEIKK